MMHSISRWFWAGVLSGSLFLAPLTPNDTPPPPTATPTPRVAITVIDRGQAAALTTSAQTVGMALWAAGYRWQWADTVIPPAITPLTTSTTITLVRAQPIQIQVDGQAIRTVTQRATVSEALAEAGVALLGDDYAVPAADAPVPTDGLLRVVRVREERIAALTPIPFETVYQALDTVEIDTVSTIQLGAYGVRRALTRVRYEDGVELSRAVEAEVVAQPPTPQIIGYGTKIVVRTLDTPDGAIEYWRAYTMYATSYAARFFKVYSNRTASGMLLTKGVVAIDRTMMPFGTKMYVPGYGFAVAGDTGGGVQGRFIDLGYDDWNYVGWHSVTMVYFLTPIPPADQIRWIIPSTVP